MVLLLSTFFVLHVWLLIYMLKAIKHSQIKHRETSDVTSASPHVLMEPVVMTWSTLHYGKMSEWSQTFQALCDNQQCLQSEILLTIWKLK